MPTTQQQEYQASGNMHVTQPALVIPECGGFKLLGNFRMSDDERGAWPESPQSSLAGVRPPDRRECPASARLVRTGIVGGQAPPVKGGAVWLEFRLRWGGWLLKSGLLFLHQCGGFLF